MDHHNLALVSLKDLGSGCPVCYFVHSLGFDNSVMSNDFLDEARRRMIGSYPDWIKKFSVVDYVLNPRLIEKLYEEKQLLLAESLELKEELKAKSSELQTLKLENQKLSLQLNEAKRRSSLMFIISVLASLLTAIGVNVTTSNPDKWTGWVMIIVGVVLEGVVFLAIPK